jgi:hypothetical protein
VRPVWAVVGPDAICTADLCGVPEGEVSNRTAFDYYPTPRWMTEALWQRMSVWSGTGNHYVLEPCAGRLAIASVLRGRNRVLHVESNDLDPSTPCDTHLDSARPEYWDAIRQRRHNRPDWGVTNVPYNLADAIVPLAVASLDVFATVLRLSWLEPTAGRAAFLSAHPPTRVIVLPRYSFKGNRKTDSVTSAWFVWQRGVKSQGIEIVTKAERDALIQAEAA